VNAEPDDDALTWGGETDPTHVDGIVEAPQTAVAPDDAEPGTSSALLVVYGIFAGAFLLYAVGWIIAVQRTTTTLANPFFNVMNHFGEVLAIASPAAWFVGVLFLTRDRRAFVRIIWLLIGIVILAPWPFILALGAK
jgi:hypothetical protein